MPETVLITGCSSGFGLLTALHFARQGARVVATMRDARKAGALEEAKAAEGLDLHVVDLDVLEPASVAAAVERAEALGPIDVLVNNAGIEVRGPIEDCDDALARRQFDTNVLGTLRVLRAALPRMRERRRGTIVNLSSVAGIVARPYGGLYSASKHALEAISEALYYEVKPFGIRVVVVEPGQYATQLLDNMVTAPSFTAASPYWGHSQAFDVHVHKLAGGAPADPQEVARLVYDAVHDPQPRLRYLAGADAHLAAGASPARVRAVRAGHAQRHGLVGVTLEGAAPSAPVASRARAPSNRRRRSGALQERHDEGDNMTISKAVLITGCSTGIGRATALRLAEARPHGLRDGAASRVDRRPRRRRLHACSRSTSATRPRCAPRSQASRPPQGAVGVLVNNAGYGSEGPVEEVPMDEVRRQFETNVFGLRAHEPAGAARHAPPGLGQDRQPQLDGRPHDPARRRLLPRHQVRRGGAQRRAAFRGAAASASTSSSSSPGRSRPSSATPRSPSVDALRRPDRRTRSSAPSLQRKIRDAYEGPMGGSPREPDDVAKVIETGDHREAAAHALRGHGAARA